MPKVVGGILALTALGSSILAGVDPLTCLWRGLLAYLIGSWATQLWYVFFTVRVQRIAAEGDQTPETTTANDAQQHGSSMAEAS